MDPAMLLTAGIAIGGIGMKIIGILLQRDRKLVDRDLADLKEQIHEVKERLDNDVKEVKNDLEKVKQNYLYRFSKVHDHINRRHLELHGALTELKVLIAQNHIILKQHLEGEANGNG